MSDSSNVIESNPLHTVLLDTLPGVGPKTLSYLQQLHLFTVADLLFHLPIRYEDRTKIVSLKSMTVGERGMIEGTITKAYPVYRGRRQLCCHVLDDEVELILRFFHFNKGQLQQLSSVGQSIRCFGELRQGYRGVLEMTHPEYRVVSRSQELALSPCLTAVYPTTQGLRQSVLRRIMQKALLYLSTSKHLQELLPGNLLKEFSFMRLAEAIQFVHSPPVGTDLVLLDQYQHVAQQRLAFEELLAHQLYKKRLKFNKKQLPAYLFQKKTLQKRFLAALPFELTPAQSRVLVELNDDLETPHPMLRLVQGDVGCGKTVIAVASALRAIEAGYQVALMAPTELLAEQHVINCQRWLEPLSVSVGCLRGSLSGVERKALMHSIQCGEVQLVVGTHALFQEAVEFQSLAFVIIDEQHRFGVGQRLSLKNKGCHLEMSPHQLMMTATPIPRTLAMTLYGDLDVSVIDALPPGRKPITTVVISNDKRHEMIERVRAYCQKGSQVYWVCTLIDESEERQCQAVEALYVQLQQALSELTIQSLHGRLPTKEKMDIMQSFKAGKGDVLVATTVIEVGVDIPRANVMIIENAERLGLSQLHQLRGRVGRGGESSFCVLLYQEPVSDVARQRLEVMRGTQDGFIIAQKDLAIRGPGEVLGTRQSGVIALRVADWLRDEALLDKAAEVADALLENKSLCIDPIIKRWLGSLVDYVDV